MNKNIIIAGGIFLAVVLGIVALLSQNSNKASDVALSSIPTETPTIMAQPTTTEQATGAAVTVQAEKAIIKTSKGDIELMLFSKDAPNTVANFIKKAESGFYDNLTFHRVEDWVIQGGDPDGNGTGGGNMPTELNNKPFTAGALGVARGGDIKISNDAQFFITKRDAQWLNGQYTNFGAVSSGIDVVEKIEIGDKILGIEIE